MRLELTFFKSPVMEMFTQYPLWFDFLGSFIRFFSVEHARNIDCLGCYMQRWLTLQGGRLLANLHQLSHNSVPRTHFIKNAASFFILGQCFWLTQCKFLFFTSGTCNVTNIGLAHGSKAPQELRTSTTLRKGSFASILITAIWYTNKTCHSTRGLQSQIHKEIW